MKSLLISSSVLILVLTALRFLFRNKISRRLQYALWLLVALRLLIPVSLLPQASFSVMTGAQALTRQWESPVVQTPSASNATLDLPAVPSDSAGITGTTDAAWNTELPTPSLSADAPEEPATHPSLSWPELAELIWLAGAAAVLLWMLAVNLRFRRQLLRTRQAAAVPGCPLPVYVSESILSPCLFGAVRPAIYLTPKAMESEDGLRHVLTHELCHYRHKDHIWALVRNLLLAVYWFDPLVWLAASLSRADGELACDEAAIRLLGGEQRLAYGKTLVDMVAVRRNPTGILCAATTMTSGKRSLKARLNRIVRRPKVVIPAVVAVVLLSAVCAACTFTGAPAPVSQEDDAGASSGTTDQSTASMVTTALSQVHGGAETPLKDPDGFLGSEILFDCISKSSAAPAVALPDSYFLLTETEEPVDGSEVRQRQYQVFRLDDGTPVAQHGDQYTTIHSELMARLEAAADQLPGLPVINPNPAASAHQDVLIDYADYRTVIFHGYFGLFVYDRASGSITRTLDLDAVIGTSQVYESSDPHTEVQASSDGRVLRVAARSGGLVPEEALWIDTASWTGGMGPWSELRQPFRGGGSAAVTTADGENVSIDLGSGLIGELQLVTGDGSAVLFTDAQPTPTTLDDAITAAVLNWRKDSVAGDEYLTEAHWLLGTETDSDGGVTAYCYVVFLAFSSEQGVLKQDGIGGTMPMVFRFQQEDTGAFQLTELWEPEGGANYGPSIEEAFPPELADAAMSFGSLPGGADYAMSLYQSCYAQALLHFHLDPYGEIGALVDELAREMEQGREVNIQNIPDRVLWYYGDYTLQYVISQFLQGNQTGSRGELLELLLCSIHMEEVEPLESAYVSPQVTFDQWKDHVVRMAEGNGVEWYAGNRTATLLLNVLGYQIPGSMAVYQEIDRTVDMICSTPAAVSNPWGYVERHPVEYGQLLSYYNSGDYALTYCFHRFLRGDVYGLEDAVLRSLMEALLGGEAIGYDAQDGKDYFNTWMNHVLQTYEANSLSFMEENYPKSCLLLEILGYAGGDGAAEPEAASDSAGAA